MTNGHYICIVKRKIHREDILKAGLELMFHQGYNATGIKEITDSISIPKGSFYNHFESKEEFALELVKAYCNNGAKMYEARFLAPSVPPLKRFEGFFDTLIENYAEKMDYKLGCVMSNFSAEMSDVNENFRVLLDEEFNRCQSIMAQCLKEAQEDGSLDKDADANKLAGFILNGWHGALVRMKSTGNATPLETFRDLTMNKILA